MSEIPEAALVSARHRLSSSRTFPFQRAQSTNAIFAAVYHGGGGISSTKDCSISAPILSSSQLPHILAVCLTLVDGVTLQAHLSPWRSIHSSKSNGYGILSCPHPAGPPAWCFIQLPELSSSAPRHINLFRHLTILKLVFCCWLPRTLSFLLRRSPATFPLLMSQ